MYILNIIVMSYVHATQKSLRIDYCDLVKTYNHIAHINMFDIIIGIIVKRIILLEY